MTRDTPSLLVSAADMAAEVGWSYWSVIDRSRRGAWPQGLAPVRIGRRYWWTRAQIDAARYAEPPSPPAVR